MRFLLSGPPTGGGSGGGGAPARGSGGSDGSARAVAAEHRLLQVIAPLNALVGFANMLAEIRDDLTPEVRQKYASRVRDAADKLQNMFSALVHVFDEKGLELDEDWVSSGTFLVAPRAKESEIESERAVVPASAELEGQRLQRVLIVDEDESNRELLAAYLAGRGYDLALAGSAAAALEIAEQSAPDLVLIDPLMTNAEDGFRIGRELRHSGGRGPVPLVFVTALVDDDSWMRALDVGAEQVVKKPVNRHELRARVKSLLELRAREEELAAQNTQLKSLQRFKDETTAMLVHDLKSPLSAMMMNLDFALDDVPADESMADVRAALAESRAAGSKLFRMIANLLDIARSDDGRLVPKRAVVDVGAVFARVADEHAAEAHARKVTISSRVEVDAPIEADPDLLGRVLANLVENALRYTYAGGSVVLDARRTDEGALLTVTNDGRPISPELRAFVFEKYAPVGNAQSISRGLGLYFCRVAVEAHGGTIVLSDTGSAATCFKITIPQR